MSSLSILMDAIDSGTDDRTNAELYKALSQKGDAKVLEICGGLMNGPFHIVTIHHDTVLHLACYNKRNNLAVALIRSLPESQFEKLTWINGSGNTILHETASNNETVEAAREMLHRAPSLLMITNRLGETPLFSAARYGKTYIFKFLNAEVKKAIQKGADVKAFIRRHNKATLLHQSILSENFDLANLTVKTYPSLIVEEDGEGLTGLQLLACNPSAFDSGVGNNSFMKLVYKYIDSSPERISRMPWLRTIQKGKLRCETAKELARILIEKDKSWKQTEPRSDQIRNKVHKYKASTSTAADRGDLALMPSAPDTPLLLATKNGCTEIVKEILRVHPQAVEHIDEDGRNILQVAIKYRRNEIINLIDKEFPIKRLRGKIDKKGNSVLHMCGVKVKDRRVEDDIRSPALVLRDDLVLFKKMERVCTTLASLQINSDGKTPEKLFIENHAQLRIDAKEWMKRAAENCSIVAVLIATVAFAAAYTVPGGPDEKTGYPLLKNHPFFIVFALADALSLTFSLTSVIIFLSILTSSFRLNDFQSSLHNKLLLGLTVLILSVSMMMIAFAATLILTISSRQNWTNVILYAIAFFPVTVFVFSYIRLYKQLIEAFIQKLRKVIEALKPIPDVKQHQAMRFTGLPSQAPTTALVHSTTTSLM